MQCRCRGCGRCRKRHGHSRGPSRGHRHFSPPHGSFMKDRMPGDGFGRVAVDEYPVYPGPGTARRSQRKGGPSALSAFSASARIATALSDNGLGLRGRPVHKPAGSAAASRRPEPAELHARTDRFIVDSSRPPRSATVNSPAYSRRVVGIDGVAGIVSPGVALPDVDDGAGDGRAPPVDDPCRQRHRRAVETFGDSGIHPNRSRKNLPQPPGARREKPFRPCRGLPPERPVERPSRPLGTRK